MRPAPQFRAAINLSRFQVGFRRAAACVGLAGLVPVCSAQLLNGSFEASSSSLTSWTVTGVTSVSGTTLTNPVNGTRQAFVVAPSGGSPGVPASQLSTFFSGVSLPPTIRGAATYGSGIKQTFTLTQPATLTFSYKYVTAESAGSGYDSSFFFRDGTVTGLASSTSAGLSSAQGVSGYTNGLSYVTTTVSLGIGAHTIGFGVYNTADTVVASAIFVDNVFTTSAIPEPATSTLLVALAAAGLVGWRARRRRGTGAPAG